MEVLRLLAAPAGMPRKVRSIGHLRIRLESHAADEGAPSSRRDLREVHDPGTPEFRRDSPPADVHEAGVVARAQDLGLAAYIGDLFW